LGQIFPIRDSAKYGLNVDVDPYNLPPEAWSAAVNVRFQNQKVTRGPVWRAVNQSLSVANPRFVVGHTFNTGEDDLFVGYLDGKVSKISSGVELIIRSPDIRRHPRTPHGAQPT
jgi:hypothetical protein